MNKLKNLIDRAIFLVISITLLILFVFWRGCDMKGPGNGPPAKSSKQEATSDADSAKLKSAVPDIQAPTEPSAPSNVAKLYLGRKGVSEDQVTWHDMGEFAGFIKQLQGRGIKEVQYTLLPDSIERYEEKWAEELKKANMRSYIATD